MRLTLLLVFVVACGPPPIPHHASSSSTAGNVHRKIVTSSPEAQRHFDLGLAHAYGFNFDEAQYEFLRALHEDPECAMCMWGIAYAGGTNINERDKRWPGVADAAEKARSLAKDPVEKALAEALIARYAPTPATAMAMPMPSGGEHAEHGAAPSAGAPDHSAQDLAYADALRTLTAAHPADDDIAILFAESAMLTLPISAQYWPSATIYNFDDKGTQTTSPAPPPPIIAEAQTVLERVLARAPDHIGAIHFYIHLMEDSPYVAKAIPYADKLATLAPGAGHLIHMASHLYLKVGRYADAEDANLKAMAADTTMVKHMSPGATYVGFTNHPAHFLWETLMWEGKHADAQKLVAKLAPTLNKLAAANPKTVGLAGIQAAWTAVRFGDWDAALALPMQTLSGAAFATHYARGLAFVAKGKLDDARAELPGLTFDSYVGPLGKERLQAVAVVARTQLEAAIENAAGDQVKAIADLRHAVELEDKLDNPMEPPLWIFPARQRLGALLLATGKPAEAADVYRADLVHNPENGWSLFGLWKALEATHDPGVIAAKARFDKAWARSDVKLTASVF